MDSHAKSFRRSSQAFDLCLRAAQIVDLASQLSTDGHECTTEFEPLGEFLAHLASEDKKHESLLPLCECFRTKEKDEDFDPESIGEALRGRFHGFAIEFGTPVREYRSENAWLAGWGNYYTQWIYADTFEKAWTAGVAWAATQEKSDLARFKKAEAKATGGAA